MPQFVEDFDANAEADRYTPGGLDKTRINNSFLELAFNNGTQQYEDAGAGETQANLNDTTGKVVNVTFTPSGVNLPWNIKHSITGASVLTGGWTYTDASQSYYPSWKVSVVAGVTGLVPDFISTRAPSSGTIHQYTIPATHYSVTGQKYGEVLPFCGNIVSQVVISGETGKRFSFTPMQDMSFEQAVSDNVWSFTYRNRANTTGSLTSFVSRVSTDPQQGSFNYKVNIPNITSATSDTTWGGLVHEANNQLICIEYKGNGQHGSLPISPIKYLNGLKVALKNLGQVSTILTVVLWQGTLADVGTLTNAQVLSHAKNLGSADRGQSSEWGTLDFGTIAPATGTSASNNLSFLILPDTLIATTGLQFDIDNVETRFVRGALDSANLNAGATNLNAGPRSVVVAGLVIDYLPHVYGFKVASQMSPSKQYAGGFIEYSDSLSAVTGSTLTNSYDTYPTLFPTADWFTFTLKYLATTPWLLNTYYGEGNKVTWDFVRMGEYQPFIGNASNKYLSKTLTVPNVLKEWRGSGNVVFNSAPFLSLQTDGFDMTWTSANQGHALYNRLNNAWTVTRSSGNYHFWSNRRNNNGGGSPSDLYYYNQTWGVQQTISSPSTGLNHNFAVGFNHSGQPSYVAISGSDYVLFSYNSAVPTSSTRTSQTLVAHNNREYIGGVVCSDGSATRTLIVRQTNAGDYYELRRLGIGTDVGISALSHPVFDVVMKGSDEHLLAFSGGSATSGRLAYWKNGVGQFVGPGFQVANAVHKPFKLMVDSSGHAHVFCFSDASMSQYGKTLKAYKSELGTGSFVEYASVSDVSGQWFSGDESGNNFALVTKGYVNNNHDWGYSTDWIPPFDLFTGTLGGTVTRVMSNASNYPFATGTITSSGRLNIAHMANIDGYVFANSTTDFDYWVSYAGKSFLGSVGELRMKKFRLITSHGDYEMLSGSTVLNSSQTPVAMTGSSFNMTLRPVAATNPWAPAGLNLFLVEGKSLVKYLVTANKRNYFEVQSGVQTTVPDINDGNDDFTDTAETADVSGKTLRTRIEFYS